MSFPRVLAGRRRALVAKLVANGLAQAGATLGGARALHAALAAEAARPELLGALAVSGAALLALRVHAAGVAERLGQDYVTRVRLRIFEAAAARPARGAPNRTGVTMTRVISDLGSLRRWVSDGLARSVVAVVTLAGALAALAFAGVEGEFVHLAFMNVRCASPPLAVLPCVLRWRCLHQIYPQFFEQFFLRRN